MSELLRSSFRNIYKIVALTAIIWVRHALLLRRYKIIKRRAEMCKRNYPQALTEHEVLDTLLAEITTGEVETRKIYIGSYEAFRWIIKVVFSLPRQILKHELHAIEPPRLAEFFVGLLVKKRYRDGLLQCLDEDFQNDLAADMSLRRAKRRYWAAALNSIGPQLWAAIKRVGLIGIVADYLRGKLG